MELLLADPKPFRSLDLPDSTLLPGATEENTTTLRKTLKDNHKRWRTSSIDCCFHNHTAHSLLALWYLSADADDLKAAYEQESSYQRAAYASPGPINKDHWAEHLGDTKYHDAYLAFISAELAAKGPTTIFEDNVLSKADNYPENGKPVVMLARLLDDLIHPLIHIGYGYEFGVPGMIAISRSLLLLRQYQLRHQSFQFALLHLSLLSYIKAMFNKFTRIIRGKKALFVSL